MVALSRRPPVDFSPVERTRGYLVVGAGRCGCASGDLVARVMTELGMTHAAAMHADPDHDWTPRDWRAHIGEEHSILFPALRAVMTERDSAVDVAVVARLEADHGVYLGRLSRGLDLPRGSEPYSVDVHGEIEDGLVRQYADKLRGGTRVQVGGFAASPLAKSSAVIATDSAAPVAHAPSSWWPWAVGSVIGIGAWAMGFGPIGIAISASSGMGVTRIARAVVAPKPKSTKSPNLLYMPPPKTFGDPEAYFRAIAKEASDVHAAIAARADEDDARVEDWKSKTKYIPVIGQFAGLMLDLANWLGKKLGSAYSEQNSPESLQDAADAIARWFQWGLVPPPARFTAKDGAKFYAAELNAGLELLHEDADKSPGDKLTAQALKAMGNLTMLHAGCPAMDRGIADAASGSGSLHAAPSSWHAGEKMGGFESIVAGIVSCEFAVPYEAAFSYARKAVDHDYPIKPGLTTHRLANAFTETMRAASLGNIPPVTS